MIDKIDINIQAVPLQARRPLFCPLKIGRLFNIRLPMILLIKHLLHRLMVLFFLSLSLFSFAQSGGAIIKTHPFYFVSIRNNYPMHGNEDVINGKADTVKALPARVDTFIIVYVETKNKLISWDTAWQKGKAYQITALLVHTPFNAGNVKGGNQVVIAPAQGNFLWQLQLSPAASLKTPPGKITMDAIILKGRYKGEKFAWKTARLREIIPLPPA